MEGRDVASIRMNNITEQEKLHLLQQTITILNNQQSAHQHFEYLQSLPIFPYLLSEIISNKANNNNLRLVSLICFKNYVNLCWKRNPLISDEEKKQLRVNLFRLLEEPDNLIATHLGNLLATIAKCEFPNDWNNPIENMIEIIESRESSDLLKFRTLLALQMIVKEISEKVLLNSRSQFQQSTENSLPYLINLFSCSLSSITNLISSFLTLINNDSSLNNNNNMQTTFQFINTSNLTNLLVNNNPQFYQSIAEKNQNLLQQLNDQLQSLKLAAEISKLTLKTIFPMIHFAVSLTPAKTSIAKQSISDNSGETPQAKSQRIATLSIKFLHDLTSTLNLFLIFQRIYGITKSNNDFCLREIIDEIILKSFRGIYKLQKRNLVIFAPLLSHTFYFTYSHFHFHLPFFSIRHSFFEKIYRTIILFYKNLLEIKPDYERGEAKEVAKNMKTEISAQLFTNDRIVEFLSILIANFLKLSNKNLQKWEESPEEFYDDFDNDAQLYNLRSTAESIFMIFNSQYSSLTAPVVIQYFNNTMQYKVGDSLEEIKDREVAYTAVGLSFYSIFDYIQFDEWFEKYFLRDLNTYSSSPLSYRIISRRIAWLFGRLVEKISQEKRQLIYKILVTLMDNQNNDIVIRLTAADSLSQLIDDMDFDFSLFAPFLSQSLSLYFLLLSQCEEENSKLKVLQFLSIIFVQCKPAMAEHAEMIINSLGVIWRKEEKAEIIKGGIMRSLCALVEHLHTKSSPYHRLLLPLILIGCDVSNPSSVFLLDDALILSIHLLRSATSSEEFYFELFPQLLKIAKNSTEHSPDLLQILNSFLLISTPHPMFLNKFGADIEEIGLTFLGNLNPDGTEILMEVMGTYLQVYSNFPQILQRFYQKLFTLFLTPTESEEYKYLYIPLIARLILANFPFFQSLLNALFPNQNYSHFYTSFFDLMEGVRQEENKKLISFAISSLLTLSFNNVSSYLAQIVDFAIGASYSVEDDGLDSGDAEEIQDGSFYDNMKEMAYKRDMAMGNPKQFCKQKLGELSNLIGEANFRTAIASVHPSLLSQL